MADLIIRNSEIMCGSLDKSNVGSGSKSTLFYVLMRDYGPQLAVETMSRLAKLCARWLGTRSGRRTTRTTRTLCPRADPLNKQRRAIDAAGEGRGGP